MALQDLFQGFVQQLASVDPRWAYTALALSALVENIVPPVPGDTVVVFSAYLVGRGILSLWPVFAATWVGSTAGFMLMYAVGRTHGRKFLQRFHIPPFTSTNLERAEKWLGRYGLLLILANRFLSGVRTVIAVSAGIGAMSWSKVAVCAAISAAVWNGALLYAGVLLGRNWAVVARFLGSYNMVVLGAAAALGAVLLIRWCRRRHKKRKGRTVLTAD